MYGAKIIEIDGNFDDALQIVRNISETTPVALSKLSESIPSRRTKNSCI